MSSLEFPVSPVSKVISNRYLYVESVQCGINVGSTFPGHLQHEGGVVK